MMRKLHLLTIISFTFIACNSVENDKNIEHSTRKETFHKELIAIFEMQNVNLNATLDSLEMEMIRGDVLKSKSGEAKLQYCQKVLADGVMYAPRYTHYKAMLFHPLWDTNIIHGTNFTKIYNEELFEDFDYFSDPKFESICNKISEDGIGVISFCRAISTTLEGKDLDEEFYRTIFLLSYSVDFTLTDHVYIRTMSKAF